MSSDNLSYDVRLYKIEPRKGKRRTTYRLRWAVAGKPFQETHATSKLAASALADLQRAASRGEAFDTTTGLPRSMATSRIDRRWVEVAREFVDAKWERSAPNHRKSTAEGLVTLTSALVREGRTPPNAKQLRLALMHWEFNTTARTNATEPPEEHREAVRWIADNSRQISHLGSTEGVRQALDALDRNLDGSRAAKSTVARKRAALSGVINFAIEKGYLEANLMNQIRTTRRTTSVAVDPGVVVNPDQARALLDAVMRIDPTLHAFFASIYYAAPRPGETRNIREDNLTLPDEGWGEIRLRKNFQQPGAGWTDDGEVGEERGLKHRDEDDVRPVPAHPDLVQAYRRHIEEHGTGVGGRLFVTRVGRGGNGGVPIAGPFQNPVNMKTVYRVWEAARAEALTPRQYASDLARRPYDLRHACVSTWLSAGVAPAQVAKWAGHSIDVLMKTYAKCLDDQENAAKKRIEALLNGTRDQG